MIFVELWEEVKKETSENHARSVKVYAFFGVCSFLDLGSNLIDNVMSGVKDL